MNILTKVRRRLANTLYKEDLSSLRCLDDDYFVWLGHALAGMTHPGNYYCFDYVMENLPSNNPILEIGSWCGRSTNALAYLLERHQRENQLLTCDKWDYERDPNNPMVGSSRITHDELRTFIKESYMRNVRFFSSKRLPATIEMFSDEFFAAWRRSEQVEDVFERTTILGGPISFCFIDGNHTYDYAKRDFEHCNEFLEAGGYVLFDDSVDGSGWEVCQVVAEVKASGRYELVMQNPNYLFRKK